MRLPYILCARPAWPVAASTLHATFYMYLAFDEVDSHGAVEATSGDIAGKAIFGEDKRLDAQGGALRAAEASSLSAMRFGVFQVAMDGQLTAETKCSGAVEPHGARTTAAGQATG